MMMCMSVWLATNICSHIRVFAFVCLVFVRLVAEQIICSNDRHEEARELPAERWYIQHLFSVSSLDQAAKYFLFGSNIWLALWFPEAGNQIDMVWYTMIYLISYNGQSNNDGVIV